MSILFHATVAIATMSEPMPEKWVVSTEATKSALREILNRSAGQLADILDEWDVDKSGTIDKREFIRAFNAVSGHPEWATDTTGAGSLFDELDRDESGFLDIDEIRSLDRKKGPAEPKRPKHHSHFEGLPALTIDMNSPKSITTQLADHLRKHSRRILDLFRSWDEDHNMSVSRDEFHRAIGQLGVAAPVKVIDHLFDAFDLDGSGEIEFRELEKILLKKTDIFIDKELQKEEELSQRREAARASAALDTARAAKKHGSRIAAMVEEFGYPSLPDLKEFMGNATSPTYMGMDEAKVECMLHRAMPLRHADPPKEGSAPTVAQQVEKSKGTVTPKTKTKDTETDGEENMLSLLARGRNAIKSAMRKTASVAALNDEPLHKARAAAAAAEVAADRAMYASAASQLTSSSQWILSPDQLRRPTPAAKLPSLSLGAPPRRGLEVPGLNRLSCTPYQVQPPALPPTPSWHEQVQDHWLKFAERQQHIDEQNLAAQYKKRPYEKPPDHLPTAYYQAQQSAANQERHRQFLKESLRSPVVRAKEAIDALHQSSLYHAPSEVIEFRLRHSLLRMPSRENARYPHDQLSGAHAILPKVSETVAQRATTASRPLIKPPRRRIPVPSSQLQLAQSPPWITAHVTSITTSMHETVVSQRPRTVVGQASPLPNSVPHSTSMPSLLPSHGRLGRMEAPFTLIQGGLA